MKKLFIIIALMVACMAAGAQTKVKVNAQGDYVSVSTRPASTAKPTGKHYVTRDGQRLPVWQTSTGKLFVNRISKKTGKTYRAYLTVEAK